MDTLRSPPGRVTFAVDDVVPASERLPERRTHEAVRAILAGKERVLSCSDYHGTIVEGPSGHGLLAAVHQAYADHRPLVLSPDVVWLTIAQGLARHVENHAEELRSRLVRHEGRLVLEVERTDAWGPDSPEYPWPVIFAQFGSLIREHAVPDAYELIVCDFSTTGPLERAASEVVLMETFRQYFDYVVTFICGIPEISLEGTTADWQEIRRRVERLAGFGLEWWVDRLRPIADQFVDASSGRVDRRFWKDIYKIREAYGTDEVNGWVTHLFPYLEGPSGRYDRKNPIVTGDGDAIVSDVVPCGWSRAPVRARTFDGERSLDFVAGFFGVEQDRETLALRPRIGWAVCDTADLELLVERLVREHAVEPSRGTRFPDRVGCGDGLPSDLFRLYDRIGGASLFAGGLEILAPDRLRAIGPDRWSLFAGRRDGSWFAIRCVRGAAKTREWQVVHGAGDPPERAAVVARSLGEWLLRTLDSEGGAYFEDGTWEGYGDALA